MRSEENAKEEPREHPKDGQSTAECAFSQAILEQQNLLVEKNMGLVRWALQRFKDKGYDMEDLFQIGTIGLLKAARRFDPELGTAFSTYAVPLIIGEIRRFLRDDGMIHISRKIREDAQKIAIYREKIEKTENRRPTVEELVEALGLEREAVVLAIGSMGAVASMDEPLSGGQNENAGREWTMEDQLMDTRKEQAALVDRLALKQLIEELDEKSRTLITLRYLKGMTQFQTAKQMGMNQVAVSRMEKKILLHFREQL